MNTKKVVVFIIILICTCLCGMIFNSKMNILTKKETKNNKIIEKNNNKVKNKTTEDIIKNENIVFLGDSITYYYPIDEIYNELPIVKSGVPGYKTDDILKELDSMVYQYNPTSVFLLIGTNDFRDEDDDGLVEKVENNIVEIVSKIKKNRKKTKIYIESIYPVNKSVNEKQVNHRDNEEISKVNNFLENYCKDNECIYIDVFKALVDSDGNYYKNYTDDGLHANSLGYARISRVLTPYIYGLTE